MMALKVLDAHVLVVLDTEAPADGEWAEYVVEWLWRPATRAGHLVFTEGGAPSVRQCYHILGLAREVGIPVAVVSKHVRVRVVVHVLSWLGHNVRAFRPDGVGDALSYLKVPARNADLIERELSRMRRSLGLPVGGGAG